MKTPDEIRKGLKCCENPNGNPTICEECPYKDTKGSCIDRLYMEARKCIRQFEAKDVEQAQRIAELEAELDAVKRERDAAVDALGKSHPCESCTHFDCQWDEPPCYSCLHSDPVDNFTNNFEWRGICPENTEVSPDA